MLIPAPKSLKNSAEPKDYSRFTTLTETSSEEVMRFKNQVTRDVKDGLKYIFQTENETTICFGACDNEVDAIFSNLIEKDDVVLIGVVGEIGYRAATVAQFYGAQVRVVHAKWGQILQLAEIREALEEHRPQILFMAHGDSSTGVLQPISEIGHFCQK